MNKGPPSWEPGSFRHWAIVYFNTSNNCNNLHHSLKVKATHVHEINSNKKFLTHRRQCHLCLPFICAFLLGTHQCSWHGSDPVCIVRDGSIWGLNSTPLAYEKSQVSAALDVRIFWPFMTFDTLCYATRAEYKRNHGCVSKIQLVDITLGTNKTKLTAAWSS